MITGNIQEPAEKLRLEHQIDELAQAERVLQSVLELMRQVDQLRSNAAVGAALARSTRTERRDRVRRTIQARR